MAVKIRLSRIGKKHVPMYRVVAVDERKKRDGAYLEDLGTYDARAKVFVSLAPDRIEYWMSVGAQPTDVVKKIHKLHKKSAETGASEKAAPAKAKKAKKESAA